MWPRWLWALAQPIARSSAMLYLLHCSMLAATSRLGEAVPAGLRASAMCCFSPWCVPSPRGCRQLAQPARLMLSSGGGIAVGWGQLRQRGAKSGLPLPLRAVVRLELGAGCVPPAPLLSMRQSTSLARPCSVPGGHGGCHGPQGLGQPCFPLGSVPGMRRNRTAAPDLAQ